MPAKPKNKTPKQRHDCGPVTAGPPSEAAVATTPAPSDNHAWTHSFAYRDPASPAMACVCGAEQELRVVDGKVVRFYRATTTEGWGCSISTCREYVPETPDGPFDWRPNLPIGEDHYAAPEAETTVQDDDGVADAPEPAVSIRGLLRQKYPEAFAPEVIDGVDVEVAANDVDLDVACSPVLRRRRQQSHEEADALVPMEVCPLPNGRYRVYYPDGPQDESAEVVKVMRARFLLQRQVVTRLLYEMPEHRREEWASRYKLAFLPPEGSALHDVVMTGRPISIPRDGDAPVDIAAVFRALSTPGAAAPTVCPTLPKEPDPAGGPLPGG